MGTTNWNTVVGTSGITYIAGNIIVVAVVGTGTGTATETAGLIARGTGTTFNTIIYSNTNLANTIVQRDNNGDFSARTLNVTSITAQGAVGGASLSASNGVSGATITATSTISAGTELQIFNKKILDYNGAITQMYNQSLGKALEVSGTLIAPAGKLYGTWTTNDISTGTSTLTTTKITTGAAATTGTITGTWSLTTGSTLSATYADLAEYYEADNSYEYGTVVMLGGDKEITIARGQGTTKVAGVISRNPAFIMNEKCKGIKLAVALQGRVPCRVVGSIRKGDLLVVSMVSGVAMASTDPKAGSIIGKALGDYDSSRVGMLEVLVGKH